MLCFFFLSVSFLLGKPLNLFMFARLLIPLHNLNWNNYSTKTYVHNNNIKLKVPTLKINLSLPFLLSLLQSGSRTNCCFGYNSVSGELTVTLLSNWWRFLFASCLRHKSWSTDWRIRLGISSGVFTKIVGHETCFSDLFYNLRTQWSRTRALSSHSVTWSL